MQNVGALTLRTYASATSLGQTSLFLYICYLSIIFPLNNLILYRVSRLQPAIYSLLSIFQKLKCFQDNKLWHLFTYSQLKSQQESGFSKLEDPCLWYKPRSDFIISIYHLVPSAGHIQHPVPSTGHLYFEIIHPLEMVKFDH